MHSCENGGKESWEKKEATFFTLPALPKVQLTFSIAA